VAIVVSHFLKKKAKFGSKQISTSVGLTQATNSRTDVSFNVLRMELALSGLSEGQMKKSPGLLSYFKEDNSAEGLILTANKWEHLSDDSDYKGGEGKGCIRRIRS